MSGWYDRQGNPQTIDQVGKLMRDKEYKRVAETTLINGGTQYWVSTVWLGLDHSFGDGPPSIFETMVFTDDPTWSEHMDRYTTEAEATTGHQNMVNAIIEAVPGTTLKEKK